MDFLIVAATIISRTFTDVLFKAAVHQDYTDQQPISILIQAKRVIYSKYFSIGLIFSTIHVYTWIICLKKFDLSFIYPMLSVSYVCIMITGRILFKETLDKYKIIGMAIITIGSILLAKSV
jgi:multidrug transporter EmrE-like cation transporter